MVEPPHKKIKSNGCTVYRCGKEAHVRDPASGFWYCWACFHDAQPDLEKTPRCFVCFSTDGDITESACGLQQSASCSVARLCGVCRSMHAVAPPCFSCWGVHGACYKCKRMLPKRSVYESRLCWTCGVATGVLRCFFCKRSDHSVMLRLCNFCCESVPVCAKCIAAHPSGKFDSVICGSCFARDWKGR